MNVLFKFKYVKVLVKVLTSLAYRIKGETNDLSMKEFLNNLSQEEFINWLKKA